MSSCDKNIDENFAPPDPGLILESLRSLGYSFETAVADIIDNCIAACAKNIRIDAAENAQYLMISDDGNGLSKEELINSLKLGSRDPLIARSKEDLGRFGLGLKLASFSYCRKFTVASKKEGRDIELRQWDLDYVRKTHQWKLLAPDISEYPLIKQKLDKIPHGTVVCWEHIDRFVANGKSCLTSSDEKNWYSDQLKKVYDHLGMVFHRFLEDGDFNLTFSGIQVMPWNPFLIDPLHLHHYPRPKPLTSETSIDRIEIYPYILRPKSEFSNDDEYLAAAGPLKTWSRAQGFYVYRGKRLITAGSWLGLKGFTKSGDTDLARIQLDISNELDEEWLLDVKKSTVKIPRKYYGEIKRIAIETREEARKVKFYKAKISKRDQPGDYCYMWSQMRNRKGEIRYKINREHAVIKQFLEQSDSKKCFESVLRLIEESVPTQGIVISELNNPDSLPEPFEECNSDVLKALFKTTISMLNLDSLSPEKRRKFIMSLEPFSEHEKLVDELLYEVYKNGK